MKPNPPFVPEDDPNNTVNSYRRKFTVPGSLVYEGLAGTGPIIYGG